VKIVDDGRSILNAGVTRDNHGGPGFDFGPGRRSWNPTLAAKSAARMGHPSFKKPQPLRAGSPDPSLRSGFRQQAPTFPFAKLRVRLTPAKRLNPTPDPSLRSGFRQQVPTFPFAKLRVRLTPAKRLNLLKKFRASTLTTLWEERTRLLG